jgi:hypothetical protein
VALSFGGARVVQERHLITPEEQMLILLWFLAGYVFIFTATWDDGAS